MRMTTQMMHHTHKESNTEKSYSAAQSSLRHSSSHFELPNMTPQFVKMEPDKKRWNSIATELSMILTLISAIIKELQSD
jgi:hypothetical protein